jgi:hypothetical protein
LAPYGCSVLPGINNNQLRPTSRGSVAIAVGGTSQIATEDIDPESLRAGPGKAAPQSWYYQEIDGDPVYGILAYFRIRDTKRSFGEKLLVIEGSDGAGSFKLVSADEIITVQCGPASRVPKLQGPMLACSRAATGARSEARGRVRA